MELEIVVKGLDPQWLEYQKFHSSSVSQKNLLYFGLIGGIKELSEWGLSGIESIPMKANGDGTYSVNYTVYSPLKTNEPLELRVLVLERRDSSGKKSKYRRVAVECGSTLPRQANVVMMTGGYRALLDMTDFSNTTFGSIKTYFPSLDALCSSATTGSAATPGPLLSLHFYGNNPRLPYSESEWRAASSALLGDQVPQDTTTFLEVRELRRVHAPGSHWKNTVPKPYQEKTSKLCAEMVSSPTTVMPCDAASLDESEDGESWLVKPLQRSVPVKDEGLHSCVTQDYWISTVNLEHMENHLLEVEIRLPLKKDGDECMYTQGSTIIASSMLGQGTHGTIDIPVNCTSEEKGHSLWVILHIQYTLHYLTTRGNNFRFLRSKQSYEAVSSKKPVGHRGLGKTFTMRGPSSKKTMGVKLAENSINAFNVAHQRGCEMVEFDVMLTHDAVPIIFHDPVIELLAKAAPSVITPTTKAQNLVPTSVPVHHLTEKKLQWVLKQSRNLGAQGSCKLKSMLLRYWSDIVALGREVTPSGREKPCHCPVITKPISSLISNRIDITHSVPTLKDMFIHTPPSLRFNIEVKYPFQPIWDENMFMQKDVFEINRFVDAILNVVLEYAEDNRTIAFSSFEPEVCVALITKQSRYNVLFLSDTSEREDLKDYRTYYVEGAIQFASAHKLSGISICSSTLMEDKECKNYGKVVVEAAHRRGLKVWTWGETNSDQNFFHEQINTLGVDGVITDHVAHT